MSSSSSSDSEKSSSSPPSSSESQSDSDSDSDSNDDSDESSRSVHPISPLPSKTDHMLRRFRRLKSRKRRRTKRQRKKWTSGSTSEACSDALDDDQIKPPSIDPEKQELEAIDGIVTGSLEWYLHQSLSRARVRNIRIDLSPNSLGLFPPIPRNRTRHIILGEGVVNPWSWIFEDPDSPLVLILSFLPLYDAIYSLRFVSCVFNEAVGQSFRLSRGRILSLDELGFVNHFVMRWRDVQARWKVADQTEAFTHSPPRRRFVKRRRRPPREEWDTFRDWKHATFGVQVFSQIGHGRESHTPIPVAEELRICPILVWLTSFLGIRFVPVLFVSEERQGTECRLYVTESHSLRVAIDLLAAVVPHRIYSQSEFIITMRGPICVHIDDILSQDSEEELRVSYGLVMETTRLALDLSSSLHHKKTESEPEFQLRCQVPRMIFDLLGTAACFRSPIFMGDATEALVSMLEHQEWDRARELLQYPVAFFPSVILRKLYFVDNSPVDRLVVDILLSAPYFNQTPAFPFLAVACEIGDDDLVERLLHRPRYIHVVNKIYYRRIHEVIAFLRQSLMAFHPASLFEVFEKYRHHTPLMIACSGSQRRVMGDCRPYLRIVQTLVEKGANPLLESSCNFLPLSDRALYEVSWRNKPKKKKKKAPVVTAVYVARAIRMAQILKFFRSIL